MSYPLFFFNFVFPFQLWMIVTHQRANFVKSTAGKLTRSLLWSFSKPPTHGSIMKQIVCFSASNLDGCYLFRYHHSRCHIDICCHIWDIHCSLHSNQVTQIKRNFFVIHAHFWSINKLLTSLITWLFQEKNLWASCSSDALENTTNRSNCYKSFEHEIAGKI